MVQKLNNQDEYLAKQAEQQSELNKKIYNKILVLKESI